MRSVKYSLVTALCMGSLFLFGQIEDISGAKILVPFFIGTVSHRNAFEPLFQELAKRGHNVTIISPYSSPKPTPNVREFSRPGIVNAKDMMPNLFENKLNNKDFELFANVDLFTKICARYYNMAEMKEILKEQFDLLLINVFANECTFPLAHHFNTPFIFLSSMPIPSWVAPMFGASNVPSINPFMLHGFSDEMTFVERVKNLIGHVEYYLIRNYKYNQEIETFYREYFPDAPSISVIEKNASLILTNTHPGLNYPKPHLPDMIEIGGMNCLTAKPLPNDLQDFLDGSGEDGFIYFSMGSFIQGNTLPEYLRLQIVKSFSKLKQRVLWKWETETMADVPPNVRLGKWLPQQSILSHPKIRMFITHGGILSLHEAVCFGVPLIGIPIFNDQHGNLELSRKRGMGLILHLNDITEETLTNSINMILNNQRFQKNAKEMSRRFSDNPMTPLDRAVFWTEYVIRHKGAIHLRSSARDLNFIQYHSLDVVVTMISILCALIYILIKLFCFCKQNVCASKKQTKVKKH